MESTELKKRTRNAVILRKDGELPDKSSAAAKVSRIEQAAERANRFSKLTDAVAHSDHYRRNEPIPFGQELFPEDWRARYADLYYELARGGPIWFDLPQAPYDVTLCERKLKAYHAKGVRYTYVLSNESEADVLMRLEGRGQKASA